MQNQSDTIEYILHENILDANTLDSILRDQESTGRNLLSLIKQNSNVSEQQFAQIIAAANRIEFINLSPDMIDPMAAHMISHEMAADHAVIPIKIEGNKLLVAMSTPTNLAIRDQIELRTGFKVIPAAATGSAIQQAIKYHFNVKNATRQAIASMRLSNDTDKGKTKKTVLESNFSQNSNDPVTKLVSSIISGAIEAGASDIHLEPQKTDMRIRYRVDGLLRDAIDIPSSAQLEIISHIKILAEMNISERRVPQNGHITIEHNGCDYDLRISSLPAVGGEKIVIRILDKSSNRWSLDKIITSENDRNRFEQLIKNPYGMILLTGPTGSGKTSTLYSILQHLNTPQKNIVTVEDPVEYRLEGITQVQVKPVAGMTFASALKSILRQDPDIILIGEIRDIETAEIAVSAALTGHLVLSTLHTNDAAGAISRLVNIGIPPFLVASALLGAVAQRLVRTLCPHCRTKYTLSSANIEYKLLNSADRSEVELFKPNGCDQCFKTGYQGRKGIYEILSVTEKIRKMIVNSESDDAIKSLAMDDGMQTLRKNGIREVLNGQTTFEELSRVVDMRED